MAGVFNVLYRLKLRSVENPLEDYLTEIFAYCLQTSPELWHALLQEFNLPVEELISIDTQTKFTALKGHESDSKPDMVAYTESNSIFFENKIDAKEGYEQLKRYAEHLNKSPKERKYLVYITRDHDPKDLNEIFKSCSANIQFISIRWYQIFNLIKPFQSSETVLELILFMKQIKIAMSNQFTPNDIIALSNYFQVQEMMEEILSGDVERKFREFGFSNRELKIDKGHMKNHHRVLIKNDFDSGIWVGLGFWLSSKSDNAYPEIRIKIECSPSSVKRNQADECFLKISNQFAKWSSYNTDNPAGWSGVDCKVGIQQFLAEDNHVNAIQSYLLAGIEELLQIKSKFPELFGN